jgi:hypothetical protein
MMSKAKFVAIAVVVFGVVFVVSAVIWAKQEFPKVAPFSGIRWHGEAPEVEVDGKWYEWVSVNGVAVSDLMGLETPEEMAKKHVGEDLPEMMSRAGHPVGDTVDLGVRELVGDKALKTLKGVVMSGANRRMLMVFTGPGQVGLFAQTKWNGEVPSVLINTDWYGLVSVDGQPVGKLIEMAKGKYGDDWQKEFDSVLMEVARKRDIYVADLELLTGDTKEVVGMTVRVPQAP